MLFLLILAISYIFLYGTSAVGWAVAGDEERDGRRDFFRLFWPVSLS